MEVGDQDHHVVPNWELDWHDPDRSCVCQPYMECVCYFCGGSPLGCQRCKFTGWLEHPRGTADSDFNVAAPLIVTHNAFSHPPPGEQEQWLSWGPARSSEEKDGT